MRCALAQEGHTCEICHQRNVCKIYQAYLQTEEAFLEALKTLRTIASLVT